MAEIGNDVSKRIYEANVHEVIAPRATPDCSKGQEISEINFGAFNFLKEKHLKNYLISALKPNYFKKQSFSSSFLLTEGNDSGPN